MDLEQTQLYQKIRNALATAIAEHGPLDEDKIEVATRIIYGTVIRPPTQDSNQ